MNAKTFNKDFIEQVANHTGLEIEKMQFTEYRDKPDELWGAGLLVGKNCHLWLWKDSTGKLEITLGASMACRKNYKDMYYDSGKVHMRITASLHRGAMSIAKDIVRKILGTDEFQACTAYLDERVESFKQRQEDLINKANDLRALGFNIPSDLNRYEKCYRWAKPDMNGMRIETGINSDNITISLDDESKKDFLAYILAYKGSK